MIKTQAFARASASRKARTRAAVLAAAEELFREVGWAGASVASIAARAGVSTETVYSGMLSKGQILREVVAAALEREQQQSATLPWQGKEPAASPREPSEWITDFARRLEASFSGLAPLLAAAKDAAASEPEIAALAERYDVQRRQGLTAFAEALARGNLLRDGLDAEAAEATLWRLTSPELYAHMRKAEGLSVGQYAEWLERSLAALLVEQRPP